MSILADYGNNVQAYIDQEMHKDSASPTGCSLCGGSGCLIGHGYYQRKPKGEQQADFIWIKRWFCKICHWTLSVIPNFLLPYRHYLVRVVQVVMAAFYESQQSWKRVTETCAQDRTPGLRTMQRWCKALAGYAPTWLTGVHTFLAQQDSSSSWLDPQGEAPQTARNLAEKWLAEMGLTLKPNKTFITHTLYEYEGRTGFDFLGFTVRQFVVGKHHSKRGYKVVIKPSVKAQKRHLEQMEELIRTHRGSNQTALIAALNPRIRGWTNYHRACSAKKIFNRMDHQLHWKLSKWAKWQNPRKSCAWRKHRYWLRKRNRFDFSDGKATLAKYTDTPIKRHVKVLGSKSPFDGDWAY